MMIITIIYVNIFQRNSKTNFSIIFPSILYSVRNSKNMSLGTVTDLIEYFNLNRHIFEK